MLIISAQINLRKEVRIMNEDNLFYGERELPEREKKYVEPNSFSRAALHLGIWSVITSFLLPFIGIVLGVLAIVFGVKSNEGEGISIGAKAGIIMGIISIVIFVLIVAVAVYYLSNPEYMKQFTEQYKNLLK